MGDQRPQEIGPSEIAEFGGEAVLHRGGVDIGLEGGAGLAQRARGAVELAGAVVAAADDGAHRAVGLDDDDGALGDAIFLAVLAQMELQRFLGGALDVHVDGGARHHRVDALLGGDALGLLERPVEEIIGALEIAAVDGGGGVEAGRQHLALGHEAALHHVGEHLVGAGAGGGQVDVRGVFGRRLEKARQHGCLGERQVLDVLAEIEVGGGRDAEGAAAHIGAVEIELEDLLLGDVHLQPERQERLLDLALDRALVGEEQVLGQLLGDGGAALDDRVGADVLLHGAKQAEEIDAEMIEEAAVLGGQHGLDDMVGHFVDRHRIRAG